MLAGKYGAIGISNDWKSNLGFMMTQGTNNLLVSLPFDIYIVGLGIAGVTHLTKEAEEVIRSSHHILFIYPDFGIEKYLKTICPRVTNLLSLYNQDLNCPDSYQSMAHAIIEAAQKHPPVSFGVYGHPSMYIVPTKLIQKAASSLNLKTKILPGISSLDSMMIDLEIDPSEQGFQMYEAIDLLVKDRPLQPDVPCIIWQISSLETRFIPPSQRSSNRYIYLQQHLLKYYPPAHLVSNVLSCNFPLLEAGKNTFPLSQLPERLINAPLGGSLYIPALNARPLANKKLFTEIYKL